MPSWAGPRPGGGPHFGAQPYGGSPFTQPPKQSNTGLIAGLSVAGVLVLVLGLAGAFAAFGSNHSSDVAYKPPPVTSYQAPSYPSTESSSTPESTTEDTYSSSPTAGSPGEEPSESESSTPAGPQPVAKLADNPLFMSTEYGLQNLNCHLSRWSTNPSAARAFFASARDCLDAVWQPVLEQAGLPFSTPNLEAPASQSSINSPCSSSGESFAAVYCGANHTIYMPFDDLQTEQYGAHPGIYLAVFAHEYGHHVQSLSGVLGTAADQQYEAGGYSSEQGQAIQRRIELQAQCFSGMFVGSARGEVDENIQREGYQDQETRGDDNGSATMRTHGTRASNAAWWRQGYSKNRTYQCNTWQAGEGDVS